MKKLISFALSALLLVTMVPSAFATDVADKSPPVASGVSTANVEDKSPPVASGVSAANVDDKSPHVVSSVSAANVDDKAPPAGLEEKVLKWREYNSDTIGWLYIPDTKINNPVMWYSETNQYYYRRNEKKEMSFNGCYFADFRCGYGDYSLPKATTIYGHSMSDSPNGKKFSQLKKYMDDDFASEHPYIFFSDGNKTYAFKVFSVFIADVNDSDMPYNVPTIDGETRQKVIDKAKAMSIREYKSQPSPTAKLLTLSTTIYTDPDGKPISYPNNYRYAVMAYAVKTPDSAAEAK